MARRGRRALLCLRRCAPDGERCRCRAAHDRTGTWRQERRRRERVSRKTKKRQTLQTRRLLKEVFASFARRGCASARPRFFSARWNAWDVQKHSPSELLLGELY